MNSNFTKKEIEKVNLYLLKKYGNIKKTNLANELNVSKTAIYYALGNCENQYISKLQLKIKEKVGIIKCQ